MRRSFSRNALVVVSALALGCQSYNFNPVSQCLIQPGSERVTLSTVSSADVLFVVDDSGSMAGEQTKLEQAFDTFIESLNAYNDHRVVSGLEPFDFHIAITTTSVFHNRNTAATCQTACGTSSNVCCDANVPVEIAKTCPTGAGCGAGYSCRTDCPGRESEHVCCNTTGTEKTTIACTTPGAACGAIQNRYAFDDQPKRCQSSAADCTTAPYSDCVKPAGTDPGCGGYGGNTCCAAQPCAGGCASGFECVTSPATCLGLTNVCCSISTPRYPQGEPQFVLNCDPGVAVEGALYPQGSFVNASDNPRVLHYDKKLYGTRRSNGTWDAVGISTTTTGNEQGFTRPQLKNFFKANVKVGTCGSGQEQGLQAARLAISKALAGRQRDTRNASGGIADVAAAWPHPAAKLVVVYVGDEDDCSSPEDPGDGVVLSGLAGADTCVADAKLPLLQQKETKVADFVQALQALGRPVGAAFVISTNETSCVDTDCTADWNLPGAGKCCDYQCTQSAAICGTATCGGQAAGKRFVDVSLLLRDAGSDVVTASICDPGTPKRCSGGGDCTAFVGSSCVAGCGGLTDSYCCYGNSPGTPAGTDGFGPTLSRIAEIVKPPSALELPTRPADAAITLLRITTGAGVTRKFCTGPALPPMTYAQAVAAQYDWWFTATRDQITDADKTPSTATNFIYINHATENCEPNPGEVYSADYLGILPPDGCVVDADCTLSLGDQTDWTCFSGLTAGGLCNVPTASSKGTCVCGKHATVCPNGP